MRIILLGPPGVGKGTQAQILIDRLNAVQLSTGDILRSAIRAGSELGIKAKGYMDAGQLVPDEVVLGLVREKLAELDTKCVIFDGFPRTIAQAEGLDALLTEIGQKLDLVIEMTLDDEVVIDRLSSRRSCPKCGAVFNLLSAPPRVDDVCDQCGHKGLELRADDKPDVISHRLNVYHEQTSPLSQYYEKQGVLKKFNGDQPVGSVSDEIRELLGA